MTTSTIDYNKLADTAADTYTNARDALNHATVNLSIVAGDRDGYQDIVTPDGHIDMPIFNMWFTQDDKDDIAEQAVAYYRAADAYKEYTQGTMQYFKDAMAASTALTLVTEVHRLTHQEDEAGTLLRDLAGSESGLTITVRPYSSNIYSFAAAADVCASADKRNAPRPGKRPAGRGHESLRQGSGGTYAHPLLRERSRRMGTPLLLALAERERSSHGERR